MATLNIGHIGLVVTGRRRLRSSKVSTCEFPRTRTSLGDWSFTVAGPRLWYNHTSLSTRTWF